jgi:hypothetical protein
MNEETAREQGYTPIMRFKIKDTRLDMAGDFFCWIGEWCQENGFGEALLGSDHECYTLVLVKREEEPEAPQSSV